MISSHQENDTRFYVLRSRLTKSARRDGGTARVNNINRTGTHLDSSRRQKRLSDFDNFILLFPVYDNYYHTCMINNRDHKSWQENTSNTLVMRSCARNNRKNSIFKTITKICKSLYKQREPTIGYENYFWLT